MPVWAGVVPAAVVPEALLPEVVPLVPVVVLPDAPVVPTPDVLSADPAWLPTLEGVLAPGPLDCGSVELLLAVLPLLFVVLDCELTVPCEVVAVELLCGVAVAGVLLAW